MTETLWRLPFPSSNTVGASFQERAGRVCALTFNEETEEAAINNSLHIVFRGVEAYKCTYHRACTLAMINLAYDSLVDLGETEWLTHIREQLAAYADDLSGLRHLMIYFDDGPCFEFICRSFQTEA